MKVRVGLNALVVVTSTMFYGLCFISFYLVHFCISILNPQPICALSVKDGQHPDRLRNPPSFYSIDTSCKVDGA
jgi:hypothetical protein